MAATPRRRRTLRVALLATGGDDASGRRTARQPHPAAAVPGARVPVRGLPARGWSVGATRAADRAARRDRVPVLVAADADRRRRERAATPRTLGPCRRSPRLVRVDAGRESASGDALATVAATHWRRGGCGSGARTVPGGCRGSVAAGGRAGPTVRARGLHAQVRVTVRFRDARSKRASDDIFLVKLRKRCASLFQISNKNCRVVNIYSFEENLLQI